MLFTCTLTTLPIFRELMRLQLSGHFTAEATESVGHANIVRSAIVKLGGVTTETNPHPIVHTLDFLEMLKQAYETEKMAAEVYGDILKTLEKHDDDELFDSIRQFILLS